jgi:CxxC-x17-CxxC domain-containing protein
MEYFRRDNRSGGRGDNRRFNDRSSRRPEMHKAVCSECGRDCEVPFRPTGSKPVFCSNCFENKGNVSPKRSDRRDSRRFGGDKKMYQAVCDKCGKDCEVPFRPSSDKPIYCDNCFGKGDKAKPQDKGNKQLDAINDKLDKILNLLSDVPQGKVVKEQKVAKQDKVNSEGRESALGQIKEIKKTKPKKPVKAKEKKEASVKKEKPKTKAKPKAKPKAKTVKAKPKLKKKK